METTNPNRVRDHLANERTYLAWMRTAVALLGFAVVILRLRHETAIPQNTGHGLTLGIMFGVAGLIMVVLSTLHYFQVQRAIEAQNYQPEKRWILVCSFLVLLIASGTLYFLI